MKKLFAYFLPTIGALAAMVTSCDDNTWVPPKPEPKPEPKPTVITRTFATPTSVEQIEDCVDWAALQAKTDTIYKLNLSKAYPLDSIQLGKLAGVLERGAALGDKKLKINKSGGTVYAAADGVVWYPFETYSQIDMPMVQSPGTAIWPYANDAEELTKYHAAGFANVKKMLRPKIGRTDNYEIELVEDLVGNFQTMQEQIAEQEPFSVHFSEQINFGDPTAATRATLNADTETMMNILRTLRDSEYATLSGNLVLGPAGESVPLTQNDLELIKTMDGRLAPNEPHAFHLGATTDLAAAAEVADGLVYRINSGVLGDFQYYDIARPDTIRIVRPMLGSENTDDFAAQLGKYPARPRAWRANQTVVDNPERHNVNIYDDAILARLGTPARPATDTYPNPDMRALQSLNVETLHTLEFSDSTSYATKQLIKASGVKTRVDRPREVVGMGLRGEIKFYSGAPINQVDAFGRTWTLVHARTFRNIVECIGESIVWQLDLKNENVLIVLDDGVVFEPAASDIPRISFANRNKILFAMGAQTYVINQYTDVIGVGNLETQYRLSIPALMYPQYMSGAYAAGKRAR
jgi:hypothetical protein